MTISKELYNVEGEKTGIYQIIIRISHRGNVKRIPTSITCELKNWLPCECHISEDDPSHILKNEIIEAQFRRVAGNIQKNLDDYLADNFDNIVDNITDIIPEPETENKNRDNVGTMFLLELIDLKIKATPTLNTRRGYRTLRNYFERHFANGPSVDNITRAFLSEFDARLRKDYNPCQSSRKLMICRLRAVINFGKDNGFIRNILPLKFPSAKFITTDRNLPGEYLRYMMELFKFQLQQDPEMSKPENIALGLFLLNIGFQGLAPVDLASIKVKQLKYHTFHAPHLPEPEIQMRSLQLCRQSSPYNDIEAVIIKTSRQKTGIPVTIISALAPLRPILISLTKDKSPDDYLLPCFSIKKSYTPECKQNRLGNFFYKYACLLNRFLDNHRNDKLPFFIDIPERITFYYARHAFCNLVDSLDVPRHMIQHMIGHRTSVLETSYLRKITPWEQAYISHCILSPLL